MTKSMTKMTKHDTGFLISVMVSDQSGVDIS